jgi:hypothetical protein
MYDFLNLAQGKAFLYGIYDIAHNQGYVRVGTSHDTGTFSENPIVDFYEEKAT